MKIFTAEQVRQADRYTIEHEPISSLDLMERAATAIYRWLERRLPRTTEVSIFCGTGNNGGDGLVVARKLQETGYPVSVWVIPIGSASPDFTANEKRLREVGLEPIYLNEDDQLPELPVGGWVVDALFGSGLSRPVSGWPAICLKYLNQADVTRLAIDLPSGLFSEDNDHNTGVIFQAHHTLCFQFPKRAFFLPSNASFVGEWEVLDIRLSEVFTLREPATYFWLTEEVVRAFVKSRARFGHKGTYGHALVAAGSYGKVGAAVLSARACLRAGAGLLTVRVPRCGYTSLQTAVPEAMADPDDAEEIHRSVPELQAYRAIGVGPGIGQDPDTARWFNTLIRQAEVPLVVDADALNLLAAHPEWIRELPPGSILTPHPGEFRRLVGDFKDHERIQQARQFAQEHRIVLLLKGQHSLVALPNGEAFFNSTGNPGMATAGSGDVLTGIITGLLARGYLSSQAALLGMFLHGLAGDMAAEQLSEEALVAGDIIDSMGAAFRQLYQSQNG